MWYYHNNKVAIGPASSPAVEFRGRVRVSVRIRIRNRIMVRLGFAWI